MNNPSTIIDIALVIVLVISVVRAYIDGFFTAIIRLIGSLGSLFGGLYVASNYSQKQPFPRLSADGLRNL